jgi:ABC-type taurine transport system substrate-binding protein
VKIKFLLSVLAAAAFAVTAHAGEVRGLVSVVAPTQLTVATHKDGEMAYAINADTKFLKLDGSAGTLADVTAGVVVIVETGSDANTAAVVRIVPPKQDEKQ